MRLNMEFGYARANTRGAAVSVFVLGVMLVAIVVINIFGSPRLPRNSRVQCGSLLARILVGVSDFFLAWWPIMMFLAVVVAVFPGSSMKSAAGVGRF